MTADDKQHGLLIGMLAGLLLGLMAVLAGGAALRKSVTIDEVAYGDADLARKIHLL